MKSIMLSINPKWVAKIMNGEKTIEIRKRFPKDFVGWVYIYCTKDKKYANLINRGGFLTGMVVGKFTLNKIDKYEFHDSGYDFPKFICSTSGDVVFDDYRPTQFELKSCLEFNDIVTYAWNKKYGELSNINNIYAWHISNLVIFDKPKELSEFGLKRAPQSWQYVDVVEKQ